MAYALEPFVAGQLGEGTRLDLSTRPPTVEAVEYLLDAPTDEDLIESFPVYLVSEGLATMMTDARLEGFTLEEARVARSREYVEIYGDDGHKSYRWLRLRPDANVDCWIDDEYRLCVSDRMMAVLAEGVLDECDVIPLP